MIQPLQMLIHQQKVKSCTHFQLTLLRSRMEWFGGRSAVGQQRRSVKSSDCGGSCYCKGLTILQPHVLLARILEILFGCFNLERRTKSTISNSESLPNDLHLLRGMDGQLKLTSNSRFKPLGGLLKVCDCSSGFPGLSISNS